MRDLFAWTGLFFSISFESMSNYNLIRGEAFKYQPTRFASSRTAHRK